MDTPRRLWAIQITSKAARLSCVAAHVTRKSSQVKSSHTRQSTFQRKCIQTQKTLSSTKKMLQLRDRRPLSPFWPGRWEARRKWSGRRKGPRRSRVAPGAAATRAWTECPERKKSHCKFVADFTAFCFLNCITLNLCGALPREKFVVYSFTVVESRRSSCELCIHVPRLVSSSRSRRTRAAARQRRANGRTLDD